MRHRFTIRCELTSDLTDADRLLSQLANAGCTAVLVLKDAPTQVALQFSKDASTAQDAVLGAARDLKTALAEARLDGAQLLGQMLRPRL